VAANHKIIAPGYRHHITTEWQPPYRAQRIEALLAAGGPHSAASFARIQMDVVSGAARELLPLFLRIEGASAAQRQALALLGAWDGTMDAARPEPLIFTAWWRALGRALYADELGEMFPQYWQPRPQFVGAALRGEHTVDWCNDLATPVVETCEEILAAALETALADLRQRYGRDMQAWRWGEAHFAQHRHRPLSNNRFLARFVEMRVPTPGGPYTVNVGRSDFADEAEPFANRHAASYRAVYDLAAPQESLFIHSGGQSGNPLSPHYATFTEAWARGDYIRMVTDRARLEAEGVQRLVLMGTDP
jgi:penicillin G amidase